MSLWVNCNACHESYPAEAHAGLLRCDRCEARMAYRIPSSGPTVVVL